MSIEVTCPKGHVLRVKNEFAGKSGLCPHCKAPIVVPKPTVSEDELLAVLGKPRPVPRVAVPDEPPAAHHASEPHQPALSGSALLRRKRVCPKCCDIISVSHPHCPRCGIPLSEWTFPMPDETTSGESSRASCHYLGLRKHEGVIVIRFGEHRILDEATLKKFGDELFHVADRPDCQNLLLNFTGVVGLCSAMLGIMLMLRKKIGLKHGKLKLCQVGEEIMDVFHTTRLGQLFEIHGNEQQAMRSFGQE